MHKVHDIRCSNPMQHGGTRDTAQVLSHSKRKRRFAERGGDDKEDEGAFEWGGVAVSSWLPTRGAIRPLFQPGAARSGVVEQGTGCSTVACFARLACGARGAALRRSDRAYTGLLSFWCHVFDNMLLRWHFLLRFSVLRTNNGSQPGAEALACTPLPLLRG